MKQLKLNGYIVASDDKWMYEWYDIESICPKDFENFLKNAGGEDIEILINSPGGDCDAGSEIRSMLLGYEGFSIATITSMAASSASIIMTGCTKVRGFSTGLVMVHNVQINGVSGDVNDMQKYASILEKYNRALAQAYVDKTGMSEKEVLEMMNTETWLTIQDAVDKKLVDQVYRPAAAMSNSICGLLTEDKKQEAIMARKKEDTEKRKQMLLEGLCQVD